MPNPIRESSTMYDAICEAYEKIQDKKQRFKKCYEIVDEADYYEIHYAISMLKEASVLSFEEGISEEKLKNIIRPIISFFTGKTLLRKAFLMDILEEARERKRR